MPIEASLVLAAMWSNTEKNRYRIPLEHILLARSRRKMNEADEQV